MNLIELDRALKQLRLGGTAAALETCPVTNPSRTARPPSTCSRVSSPTNWPGIAGAC